MVSLACKLWHSAHPDNAQSNYLYRILSNVSICQLNSSNLEGLRHLKRSLERRNNPLNPSISRFQIAESGKIHRWNWKIWEKALVQNKNWHQEKWCLNNTTPISSTRNGDLYLAEQSLFFFFWPRLRHSIKISRLSSKCEKFGVRVILKLC